ncbi:MAG: division/cell wall cluster transcriptional repressor MraZ [Candidatus Magasanikbacteria bacterium]
MLLGEYTHSLDSKGRVAIPSKFRSELGDGAIITRGLDNCLFVFGMNEWKELADELIDLPLSQKNSRAFARLMLAGATDVRLDSQGRVLIPEYLREYADLDDKVVVAGLYNRMEIWDTDKWAEYKEDTEEASEEIAEKLSDIGI